MDNAGVRFSVVVIPRARRARIEELGAASLRVAVTAPPHDGQANEAVIAAVAAHLRVPRSRVRIVRGHAGRHKILEIEGLDP
jgi:uncharacterized protein (TIGR00251 family)